MDKETLNIMELHKYMNSNPTVDVLSRALTVFRADVTYEDELLESVHLSDVNIRFQHSYNNDLTIIGFEPPYYNNFRFSCQDFSYRDGCLYIEGTHHDNPKCRYRITVK